VQHKRHDCLGHFLSLQYQLSPTQDASSLLVLGLNQAAGGGYGYPGDVQTNAVSGCSSCSALHHGGAGRVCLRSEQCNESSLLEEQLEYQH
jgi:hypothetical protein